MRESGFYPPGAEFDPRAPWNQPEPCEDCDGAGCSSCEPDEGPDPDDLRDAALDREYDRAGGEGRW